MTTDFYGITRDSKPPYLYAILVACLFTPAQAADMEISFDYSSMML